MRSSVSTENSYSKPSDKNSVLDFSSQRICLQQISSAWIFVADKEFDALCFDFGIELDDVVRHYMSESVYWKKKITAWFCIRQVIKRWLRAKRSILYDALFISPNRHSIFSKGEKAAEGLSEEIIYKIDVPANRYDILCLEGIARAIR